MKVSANHWFIHISACHTYQFSNHVCADQTWIFLTESRDVSSWARGSKIRVDSSLVCDDQRYFKWKHDLWPSLTRLNCKSSVVTTQNWKLNLKKCSCNIITILNFNMAVVCNYITIIYSGRRVANAKMHVKISNFCQQEYSSEFKSL